MGYLSRLITGRFLDSWVQMAQVKVQTIKILTTLLLPSSGNVKIFGLDVNKSSSAIRKRIGVVSQQPSSEANLTVERAMDLYGLMWGIERTKRKEKITEIINHLIYKKLEMSKMTNCQLAKKDEYKLLENSFMKWTFCF